MFWTVGQTEQAIMKWYGFFLLLFPDIFVHQTINQLIEIVTYGFINNESNFLAKALLWAKLSLLNLHTLAWSVSGDFGCGEQKRWR